VGPARRFVPGDVVPAHAVSAGAAAALVHLGVAVGRREARRALALARDVVTEAPVTAGTVPAAVHAVLAVRTGLGANRALRRTSRHRAI